MSAHVPGEKNRGLVERLRLAFLSQQRNLMPGGQQFWTLDDKQDDEPPVSLGRVPAGKTNTLQASPSTFIYQRQALTGTMALFMDIISLQGSAPAQASLKTVQQRPIHQAAARGTGGRN